MACLFNLILGYIQITVESAYTERFLNLISQKNIPFWGLEILEYGKATLFLHAKNFKRLKPIAKKTASKIKIIRKRGLPFFMHKFRGRFALFFGIIVFCTAIWALTSFVWIIDIYGGDPMLYPDIMTQLSYNGLKLGTFSPGIKHDELKNDILLTFPELSNITINVTGCHAVVTLYMKTPVPEITDYSKHSNIISDYDGIIKSITVTSGTPEVSPGEFVRRGQLLAGGYMTGRTGVVVEYRAIADIIAQTTENHKIVISQKTQQKHLTGDVFKKYSLVFGRKRINLYFGTGNSYTSCDKMINKVQFTLPFGLKLPIYLETCAYNQYSSSPYAVTHAEAEQFLSQNADKYVELEDDDKLINRNFSYSFKNGCAILDFTAECERKIGVEQMIPKGE